MASPSVGMMSEAWPLPDPPKKVTFQAVEASRPVPGPGFWVSEDGAANLLRMRQDYDALREMYVIRNKFEQQQQGVMVEALRTANQRIDVLNQALAVERQGTWWTRNAAYVGASGGVVMGVLLTIGVASAVK